MLRPITSVRRPARRGALLIAVLGMLTLLAIFALFFVFYADAEATGARIAREKEAVGESGAPNDYAMAAFNFTLQSILFDGFDDSNGVMNPFRGYGLNRTMYGWDGVGGPSAPFSGFGKIHDTTGSPTGIDRAWWINHSAPITTASGTFILDPEWTPYRTAAQVSSNTLPRSIPGNTYVPLNAPYTYPDLKDLLLAIPSPATGEILGPSMHRNWLFNLRSPALGGSVTDWLDGSGRTRVLRPRPVDQLTAQELGALINGGTPTTLPATLSAAQRTALNNYVNSQIAAGNLIPYPPINANNTVTGDVQNLQGGVGVQQNDSILVDIGLPPRLWNGKWIKPLAAVLVTDLDSKLNVNAHGNIRGAATPPSFSPGFQSSYAGYGPNEVSMAQVLGNADATNIIMRRYGITQSWAPNTGYSAGAVVANSGNFYQCIANGTSAGTGPGPTGNGYNAMSPFSDGGAKWVDLSIGLTRNGKSTLQYDRSGVRTPMYSGVNFDAGGNMTTNQFLLPTFGNSNPFQTSPSFTQSGSQSYFDDNFADGPPTDTYNKYFNHPLLFNPNDWPASVPPGAGKRTFPLSDLKRFSMRYAANSDWYQQTDVANSNYLPFVGSLLPSSGPGPNYRLDGSHQTRGWVTTLSTSLDRPSIVGNFNTVAGGGPLSLMPNQLHPINTAYTGAFQGGAGNDFASANDFRNPKAALGPVDLNRPLADYRDLSSAPNVTVVGMTTFATPQPLSPTNNNNFRQAWADRHNLAKDIFARLIVTTGAMAFVDTASGSIILPQPSGPGAFQLTIGMNPPVAVSQQSYDALRYLAQIAVNAVDTIDNDDVSTVFAWNPGGTLSNVDATPLPSMTGVEAFVTAGSGLTPSGLVFGVEKPRLVINEAYGELTNGDEPLAGATTPTAAARIRFYVELMNPTTTPYAGTGTTSAPLGDGSVKLFDAANGIAPYQMIITRENGTVANKLKDPSNSAGTPTVAAPDISFNFSTAKPNQLVVSPANGAWKYASQANGTQGYIMVGPPVWTNPHQDATNNAIEFNPDITAAPWNQMVVGTAAGTATAMEYAYPGATQPTAASLQSDAATNPMIANSLRRHVIVLRRLTSPYQPGPTATNPYITVDTMDWVPAFDALARGNGDMMTRSAKGAANITTAGFEAVTAVAGRRYSVGKVQPYAGFANATPYTAGNNTFPAVTAFPNSMVIAQNPNPANTSFPSAGQPLHTFFRSNGRNDDIAPQLKPAAQTYNNGPAPPAAGMVGGETIMAPFDWLVHFDRPIVNQLELLSLQATKPHELTQYFLQPPSILATGPIRRGLGQVPWFGVSPPVGALPPAIAGQPIFNANGLPSFDVSATNPNALTNNGLFRAMELLRVKPWMNGTAQGGKLHGKININTIQDVRMLRALLDASSGNYFGQGQDDVLNVWNQMFNNPSPPPNVPFRTIQTFNTQTANGTPIAVPLPGPTIDDADPNNPPPGTSPPFDRPFRTLGTGEYSPDVTNSAVVARRGTGLQDTLLRVNPTTGDPLIWSTNLNTSPNGAPNPPHPYLQSEMARKMFNNTTTTSHAFSVSVTIVFHEVRMNGTTMLTINDGAGTRFLIGKEAYKDVPGDLRQQFYAIVDRSNLVLQPGGGLAGNIQPQPFSAALDVATSGAAPGQLTPIVQAQQAANPNMPPPPGMGFVSPPQNSVNVYLANVVNSVGTSFAPGVPYANNVNGQAIIFSDGKPVTIQNGSLITIGLGASQEPAFPNSFVVNYVNNDGSLNVGDPMNQLGNPVPRPFFPTKVHVPGELVSNFVTGNPGPVGGAFNPAPFDAATNPNSVFRGVVPYAKRVR